MVSIPDAPLWLDAVVVVITLTLATGWLLGLRHALVGQAIWGDARLRVMRRASSAILLWLTLLTFLAELGFFTAFGALPPRMFFVLGPTALFCGWVAALGCPQARLAQIPPHWLIMAHAFRLPVELMLWAAAQVGAMPVLVTWEGRNWDVLTPLAALALGEWVRRRGLLALRPVVLLFHAGGLGLLINVVASALMAAPTPLQRLFVEPSTAMVGTWPWIWLPGFIVPTALLLHLLGLRQLSSLPR